MGTTYVRAGRRLPPRVTRETLDNPHGHVVLALTYTTRQGHARTLVEVPCHICGAPVQRRPSELKRYRQFFCSDAHLQAWKRSPQYLTRCFGAYYTGGTHADHRE